MGRNDAKYGKNQRHRSTGDKKKPARNKSFFRVSVRKNKESNAEKKV